MDIQEETVKACAKQRAAQLEALAEAFLAETGLLPSQAVLVEKIGISTTSWHFRAKTEEELTVVPMPTNIELGQLREQLAQCLDKLDSLMEVKYE